MRPLTTISTVLCLSLAALPSVAQEQQQQQRENLENLKAQLLQLRVNPYPPARERTAQVLVGLIRRTDVSLIDRATIDELAGLLEDNSDAVRGRMAIALGNIGQPAKHAVPALEKALARAKQQIAAAQANPQPAYGYRNYGVGTSADSICFALQRLEATIPAGCVDGRYEPQVEPSSRELTR